MAARKPAAKKKLSKKQARKVRGGFESGDTSKAVPSADKRPGAGFAPRGWVVTDDPEK